MLDKEIDTDKLKLAKLKYFDKKRMGVEVSEINAYAFLVNIDGKYVNVFDESLSDIPVFDRTFYSNTTSSGIDFGTKLIYLSGKLETGPCYIVEQNDMKQKFGSSVVSLSDIERYILDSNDYFIDRESILSNPNMSRKEKRKYKLKRFFDQKEKEKLDEFFSERDCGFQYIK